MTNDNIHVDGFMCRVAALIRSPDRGRILLTTWPNDPLWRIPGGRLKHMETIEAGITREMEEELGLKADFRPAFMVQHFLREPDRHGLYFYFESTLPEGHALLQCKDRFTGREGKEIFCWHDIASLPPIKDAAAEIIAGLKPDQPFRIFTRPADDEWTL